MKTYETWQVVKALTEHRSWTAKAPSEAQFYEQRASTNPRIGNWVRLEQFTGPKWGPCIGVDCRSDWRLYDENGNEVTDYE